MAYWHVDDLEDVYAIDDLDSGLPSARRAKVREARIAAFLLRKRLGREVPTSGSEIAKADARRRNRLANKHARRLIVGAKRGTGRKVMFDVEVERSALVAKMKRSILLDSLVARRSQNWVPMSRRLRSRTTTDIIVDGFSFLKEPNKALASLRDIARAEAACLSAEIHFPDDTCEDIGAWLVLAAMRQDMAPIFTGGKISDEVSNVIAALNMERVLGMRMPKPKKGVQRLWSFPLHARRRAGTSTSESQFLDPQMSEEVATDLCTAINAWLAACAKQMLSLQGRRNVHCLVTEALDNAERHSRPEFENDGDWWMTGFMTREDHDSGPRFKCQLALLSIGSPISETVVGCDSETLKKMDGYVSRNRTKLPAGLKHRSDHLRTIYALQDFVTRDKEANKGSRGGVGFGTMLRVFADLAGHDRKDVFARLGIVSGRTCLHLSREDCDHAVTQSVGKPFNIWLNDEHDDGIPPREGAIVELDHEFRGTLISMSFELDPDYLERTVDDTN